MKQRTYRPARGARPARSRSVAGRASGGGTRVVGVHRAFNGGAQRMSSGLFRAPARGRAWAATRGKGKKKGLHRQGY